MQNAFSSASIFTGDHWLHDHTVITNADSIETILPSKDFTGQVENFNDCMIVPGFVDVQVYGAAKKLFSLYPSAQTLRLMNEVFAKQGTLLFLPTLATNTIDLFKIAIDAVRDYWNQNGKGVLGVHLEGPWINEIKSGAHLKEWIHRPTIEEVKDLLDYGKDVIKMITVAPEVCSDEVLQLIRSYNIIISAGHSNASYEEAIHGFKNGIATVTHLYNAMSPLLHREPGLTGAAFHNENVYASIIPDGHHVNFPAVSIAKKIMGGRLFAITDAVTETNEGPYRHQLQGEKYECNGVLSGSALSMHKAFINLVNKAGIKIDEALKMCGLYPASLIGCANRYGKIAQGYTSQMLVLNRNLELIRVLNA